MRLTPSCSAISPSLVMDPPGSLPSRTMDFTCRYACSVAEALVVRGIDT
ncbi:Uncharacterised protein [Mycobacteroides abscessus]|nr:Uncharacterised protein [Mycobacteroides abscessus]